MVGAVKSIDPETGHYFDDTKRYIEAVPGLREGDKRKIYEENALTVYSRLKTKLSVNKSAAHRFKSGKARDSRQ
jgi:4-oxalmesaconate hydratase